MMLKAKATFRWLLWLALVLGFFAVTSFPAVAETDQPTTKTVPQNSYELRYLGSKLNKNTNFQCHIGTFLFIWKRQYPVKILTLPADGKKTFDFYPTFRVHRAVGWHTAGGWEGPEEWVTIQPGQVVSFSMGMDLIESKLALGFDPKEADKACLILVSKEGDIVSEEFPLPLLPKIKK